MARRKFIFGKALLFSGLFYFIFFTQQSCKKTDLVSSVQEEVKQERTVGEFFKLPASASPVLQRVAKELERQNGIKPFLTEFILKDGFPVWEKASIETKRLKSKANSISGFNGDGLSDTTVFIPLVINSEKYVHGFIWANVKDSILLKIYRQSDFVNFPFQTSPTQTDSTSAENFALRMMLMDYEVFGSTEFEVKDKRLFNYSSLYKDTENVIRHVKFDSTYARNNLLSNGTVISSIMRSLCVIITTTTTNYHCHGCLPGNCDECIPLCKSYTNSYQMICETWNEDEGEGWPGGGGNGGSGGGGGGGTGGSGGGGNPPCSAFGATMINGVVPINCEPGPGGNPWPPQSVQNWLDMQWVNSNISDSTADPCITNTINSLKNINPKLPALIRSFFDTVPTFRMTLKKYVNSGWDQSGNTPTPPEGAITTTNYTTNIFNVAINRYFSDCTDLGLAATIIHEALHCQLMNWYRLAYFSPDSTSIRISLATQFGYLFPPPSISASTDSMLRFIINGQNPTQHQDMILRYKNNVANALYEFALSKGINVTLQYCQDLAWTGCFDSKAFADLSTADKDRIKDRCFAEKDPYSNLTFTDNNNLTYTVNSNSYPHKGHPCH